MEINRHDITKTCFFHISNTLCKMLAERYTCTKLLYIYVGLCNALVENSDLPLPLWERCHDPEAPHKK